MNIYPLDAAILKSSEYRDKWQERDFYDCMAHLKNIWLIAPIGRRAKIGAGFTLTIN